MKEYYGLDTESFEMIDCIFLEHCKQGTSALILGMTKVWGCWETSLIDSMVKEGICRGVVLVRSMPSKEDEEEVGLRRD